MNAFVRQLQWFNQPEHNHIVQFYPAEDILVRYLQKFVRKGLENDEACIVIATPAHIKALDNALVSNGINLKTARRRKLYIAVDAKTTLNNFMDGRTPDWNLFKKTIGPLLSSSSKDGRHVRAYGEMVALLWEDDNPEAVVKLEKFWNEIARTYNFSLYCAYPTSKFDGTQADIVSEINNLHALAV